MTAPWLVIWAAWLATVGVWIAKAREVKPTHRAQSSREQAFQVAALVVTALMFGRGPRTELYATDAMFAWSGAALTLAGCAFAVWARLRLGSNWSPHAVIKADHD